MALNWNYEILIIYFQKQNILAEILLTVQCQLETCTHAQFANQHGKWVHSLINGSLDDAMNIKHGYFWRQFLVCNSLNVNFQASYEVEISILWIEEKGMVQFTEQNAFLENSHIIRLMKPLANFICQSVSPVWIITF